MPAIDLRATTTDIIGKFTYGPANIAQQVLLPSRTLSFDVVNAAGAGKYCYVGVADGADITGGGNPYHPTGTTVLEIVRADTPRSFPQSVLLASNAGGDTCYYRLRVK